MQVRCENRAWNDEEEETHDWRNNSNEEGKRWGKKKKRKKQSIATLWEGGKIRTGCCMCQSVNCVVPYLFEKLLVDNLSVFSWAYPYSLPHSPSKKSSSPTEKYIQNPKRSLGNITQLQKLPEMQTLPQPLEDNMKSLNKFYLDID